MAKFTDEQNRVARLLDSALESAHLAGLALRVLDGRVLLLRSEDLKDPRFLHYQERENWIEDCTLEIAKDLDADGG